MRLKSHLLLTAVFTALAGPATVQAQVLWDNGTPDNLNGYAVNFGYEMANDFTLTSFQALGSFDWYVLHQGLSGPASVSSSFLWRIYSNGAGNLPGSEVASGLVSNLGGTRTATYGCCGYQAYFFNVSLSGTNLSAGTYWLGLSQYTSNYAGNQNYWATSNASNGNQSYSYQNGGWGTVPVEGAFTLYGDPNAVPEPATLTLLATGLASVAGAARRKLKKRRQD